MYVRVNGRLKTFQGKTQLVAFSVRYELKCSLAFDFTLPFYGQLYIIKWQLNMVKPSVHLVLFTFFALNIDGIKT